MADIAGTYTSPYTSPTFVHSISYSESSRSGSSATYAFTIQSHMTSSSSSFGYSLGWSLTINGQNFTGTIKNASPTWSGTTVYTTNFSVTVSCGSGGGTLSAELWVTRPGNEGNSGKLDTGSCTVSLSSWNTKPYWNNGSWCSVSPSGTIPENTDTLTISWGGAGDTEGNTIYYYVKRYVNGSYSDTIASGTTSTSCTDYIGSGNQGVQYYYSVEMHDGSLWADSAVWSNTVTKNVFTTANLSTSSSIGFSSTSVAFSYSGASNTNGDGGFSYSLSCSNVTVYNPTSTPTNVTIYKSGGLPSGTYIKYDDIKSATSSNSYTGTFTFTLTTRNNYSSSGTSSCTMWVDLRVSPTAFSITGTGGYYTIASTNYYVSNRQNPTVSWSSSTDQLGGSITYDIQVKLGNGNFYNVLTNITGNSASVPVGGVTSRTTCTIRVISKTSFGYTNQADSSVITLDYYNPPTVTFTSLTRNINDMTIAGTVTINTSITGISVTTLSYSGKTSGNLTLGTSFSKQETSLLETDAYTFSVTAQDGAGAVIGTSATTNSISIPRYTPMLSIRELGVGVNALADATYKFKVGGNANITENLNVGGTITGASSLALNGAITGVTSIDCSGEIHGGGGSGNAFRVGDDSRLVDINTANMFGVQGVQDATQGGIAFGSAKTTAIYKGTGNALRVGTDSGYIDVGAQNTSFAHIYTDRAQFALNKDVVIQGRFYQGAMNQPVWGSADFALTTGGRNLNISGSDLNNYIQTGMYCGSNCPNNPYNSWWFYIVQRHVDDYWVSQTAFDYFSNTVAQRWKRNGAWTGWVYIKHSDNFTGNNTGTGDGNGYKWVDGTMFTWGYYSGVSIGASSWGVFNYHNAFPNNTWKIFGNYNYGGNMCYLPTIYPVSNTQFKVYQPALANAGAGYGNIVEVFYFAIGN